jgi:hypothetical protein
MWRLTRFQLSIPRGSIYGLLVQTELENITDPINQITLPDSGEIILMVKTATQTRSIHRLFTRRKRIVQHMKVENNACIWPKRCLLSKPKNNWSIGSKDWKFKVVE